MSVSAKVFPALEGNTARQDTWQPDPDTDPEDGRAMNELLFVDGDLRYVRPWIGPAAEFVVAGALERLEAGLATASEGDVIRVLDYGAGTGLATIGLLRACRERNIEERLERSGASLEVHVVDRPNPWFAHGFTMLSDCAWTRFHSLDAGDGRFRPLIDVTGGRNIDAVMVANVFHLIPARALGRAATDLAAVVKPGGRLTWCSPDLTPAGPGAVLFHDSNRELRKRWVDVLRDEPGLGASETGGRSRPAPPVVAKAAARVRESLDPAARRDAERRADAHILSEPNDVRGVIDALEANLDGHVGRPVHETLEEDFIAALLVPSIQAEYMAEIEDRGQREEVIRELMLREVLPGMAARGARTSGGLNVRWSLGSLVRPAQRAKTDPVGS